VDKRTKKENVEMDINMDIVAHVVAGAFGMLMLLKIIKDQHWRARENQAHAETVVALEGDLTRQCSHKTAARVCLEEARSVIAKIRKQLATVREDRNRLIDEERQRTQNPHRTKDGLHICEDCGTVYRPELDRFELWNSLTGLGLTRHEMYPIGKSKKTTSQLLLKEVNSDRFCPSCEKKLNGVLKKLTAITEPVKKKAKK